MQKIYTIKEATFKEWTLFYFLVLITHPLLDAHTTWGTKLFWPLDIRLAHKNIFVIDPIYTLPLLICIIAVLFYKRINPIRKKINNLGLLISSLYMILTIIFKSISYKVFKKSLQEQQINYTNIIVKPTALNSILWTANIETADSYLIGYYSLMDKNKKITFTSYPKNHELLGDLNNNSKVKRLIAVTESWFTISKVDDKLYLNDLRFGLLSMKPNEDRFVFSFLLEYVDNELVISENKKKIEDGQEIIKDLWKRIKGIHY